MDSTTKSLPKDLGELVANAAAVFAPKPRLTVSQAAAEHFVVHSPPAYTGKYKPDKTPYMTEPMNNTMSRDHTGLIFVGPAQSGKTLSLVLVAVAVLAHQHVVLPRLTDALRRRVAGGTQPGPAGELAKRPHPRRDAQQGRAAGGGEGAQGQAERV